MKLLNKKLNLIIIAIIIAIAFGALLFSIGKKTAEAEYVYKPIKKMNDFEPRNEKWGEVYNKQYESSAKTEDMDFRSKYNGSQEIDMLELDPNLVILWAGYGFSKDYTQGKGHSHAVKDLHNSLRTGGPTKKGEGPMPSTCWTCKSPDVPRLMDKIGVAEFYKGKWSDKGEEIVNSVGCADCHNPKTMDLQITRPALVEAFESMGKDITKATHNEMRSLVCAQCHVEYYFNKNNKDKVPYLTFPWKKGMKVEQMEEYYDELKFKDWTHKISKAPMLKAQHPGYELFLEGIHAKKGVSCADCHMPYVSEGSQKYSNHQLRSPLANVENSCMVCHREEKDKLIQYVYDKQDKVFEARMKLEKILVKAHIEAKAAWDLGANEKQMKDILLHIRHSQWRWDYAVASHGGSFHATEEALRILASGIDKGQEARVKLASLLVKLGLKGEVKYPDISTKEKAQKFIGLDIPKLRKEKEVFKNGLMKEWDKKAKEREAKYDIIK